MAKQVGPLFFTGTVDDLIFYKLGDQYFMRSKGSYKSGKQMRKDPTYKRTMQQADRFGKASNMLKKVYYRHLPKAVRKHGLYGKLTGLINKWLYQGKSPEEARELLIAHCKELAATVTKTPAAHKETVVVETSIKPITVAAPTAAPPKSPMVQAPSKAMKKARYLSNWRVRRDGRLSTPQCDSRGGRLRSRFHAAAPGAHKRVSHRGKEKRRG